MSALEGGSEGGLRWFGWTDVGKVRRNNEDSYLAIQFDAREVQMLGRLGEGGLLEVDRAFAVCDGMGGAKAGEFASRVAVEQITRLLPRSFAQRAAGLEAGNPDLLNELFTKIHKALVYMGGCYEECAGMETTLSLCWFSPGWMHFAHVGDSRIYYLPGAGGDIRQISHDDTYVGWLFREGKINEREARTHPRRNVLQKALGGGNQFVDPQLGAVGTESGDRFLICSDGLTEGLYDHHVADLMRSAGPSGNPARALVEASVELDGKDNTTAVVIEVI
jgi:serine/threonine protein phosphatase PrpC